MKRAVFPGTFDPITLGHVDIITRALPLFDQLIIAIGVNAGKQAMFSLEERISFIQRTFDNPKIRVESYEGLTVNFCKRHDAKFLVRGLRNSTDLNYELPIAQANYKMAEIDTIFLLSSPEVAFISSTIVRDIMKNEGDFTTLVPAEIL